MQNRGRKCGLILAAVAGVWAVSPVLAGYSINALAAFNGTNGAYPTDLILSGSTLYGTTIQGGANNDGTIFSVPVTGGVPTVLATFNGSNGAEPQAGLTLLGNTFYGTTQEGGANGQGTVFSIPVTGGSPTTLVTFNNTNGGHPDAGLILSGNTLYGTTNIGGTFGDGTVFSVSIATGKLNTLATFNGNNGNSPDLGTLVLSGDMLYGTTYAGGANSLGTVFSVPVAGGAVNTLGTFNDSNGAFPAAGLIQSGSMLYGTTVFGGKYEGGTVFSVPTIGGPITTLAAFNNSISSPYGSYPRAGLTLIGNTLYGTTSDIGVRGFSNFGTVFSVPITGGPLSAVVQFNSLNGQNPESSMILSGNTLYGTTLGFNSVAGTVFSLTYNHASLSLGGVPTNFGSYVGTLTLTGGKGNYNVASASFPATSTGYLSVSGFNPQNDSETYALQITDSVPGNLAADLADAASK